MMRNKLSQQHGMSLIETLAAVLVASLIAMALAVGVGSALRVYRDSSQISEAQILSSTLSQAVMDELRYSQNITGNTNPVFTSRTFGTGCSFGVNDDGQITLGKAPLIGSGSYSDKQLKADLTVTYDQDDNLFQVTLSVSNAENTELNSSTFSVRSLSNFSGECLSTQNLES